MNLKKTTNIILLLITLFSIGTYGQDQKIKALKIGDKVPDFLIENIKNSEFKTRRASELYGSGLLIINFWTTSCVPCLRAMPDLDQLAEKYKTRYHMLCVSPNTDKEVNLVMKRNPDWHHLMFLSQDSILTRYFPHKVVPHNVWIDKNGVVIAITDDYEVNEKNIEKAFEEKVALRAKNEELDFDMEKPLKTRDSAFLYRSVITAYRNVGDGGEVPLDTNSKTSRFFAWNATKTNLIWYAYMKRTIKPSDRNLIHVNTKDTTSFFFPYGGENSASVMGIENFHKWELENNFCYELSFNRKVNPDLFYGLMVKELSLFFNVNAKVEKKETLCWVLTKMSNKINQFRVKDTQAKGYGFQDAKFIAKNQSLDELIRIFSTFFSKELPFVNDTGIGFNIDMEMDLKARFESGQALTIDVLRGYLNAMGLDLKKKKHAYPHLFIDDLNP
ncbi:hypothetical protein DBR11_28955 [Pedobacter sp. HMWF019]|uniref:TlpA family protein disulfide reductase n=1 Tax=Pedobacter sp. HMWF019 TaxID=2056856 RepID=UPI000D3CC38C|nr:TlpA disulfide reductase family protein [Pedobacter sp. HMWF019]PTS91494.1 hypothetical protein DBR11_28955 [Pedobacter sp. HMWF019]